MSTNNYEYKIGGSLLPNTLCYVERAADSQLANALKKGEFCYVLNSRQMGKSSLKARTIHLLESEGFACAAVDITKLGTKQVNADRWYKGLVVELARVFGLNRQFDLKAWRHELSDLSALQQLSLFIEDILLTKISQPRICIFIEEIDNVKSLDFSTDDLFALIRTCYEQRVNNPEYNRLTFCLLGVAAPSDLITNKHRTPFNIGNSINLTGFSLTESRAALTPGLSQFEDPDLVLAQILEWTGGQPFLTQKLCNLVAKSAKNGRPNINTIVRELIIDSWESKDTPPHLTTVRDRLKGSKERQVRLLAIYQNILLKGEIDANDSPEHMELQLSGLVVKDNDKLRVYNHIYKLIFNRVWVERELISLRPDFYSVALASWLLSNRLEESWLLHGQALKDAQQWAADKSLSDDDYRFLDASRKLEQQEIQRRLDLEAEAARILAEANEVLVNANQTLEKANINAKQRIQSGGVILFCSLVGSIFMGILAARLNQESQIEQLNSLRITAIASLNGNQQLDALLKAVKAATKLQATNNVDEQMKYSVKSVLQQSLFQISEQNRLEGHSGKVRRVKFSPDGEQIVTAGEDGTVRTWNQAGKEIHKLGDNNRLFRSVGFSPDGKTLAAIDARNNIMLWNSEGKEILQIKEGDKEDNFMGDICLINGGKQIISSASNNTVKIRNTTDGKNIAILTGSNQPTWSIICSDQYKMIITGDRAGFVNIWDFNYRKIHSFQASEQSIYGVALSQDGTKIFTALGNGTLKLWNLDGKELKKIDAHGNQLTSINFSPDGQKFVTTSMDKTVKLWNAKTGEQLRTFKGHEDEVFSASFSNDGKILATAAGDETVRFWNLDEIDNPKNLIGHQNSLWSIDFNPKYPHILASAGDDKKIKLWNSSGEDIRSLPAQSHSDWNRIWSLKFSPDGKTIATGNYDKTIRLLDLQGNNLQTFSGHEEQVLDISFSPDGNILASASHDGSIKLWNIDGRELKTIVKNANKIFGVTFHPEGKTLASAHNDGSIRLWNLEGKQLNHRLAHRNYITKVSFSPDGKTLASASSDKTIQLWQLDSDKIITLKGHTAGVTQVSFSPDGKHIASASTDNTIRIWNVNSGKELTTLKGSFPIWNVKYNPDGKTLASVNDEGTVQLWNAETPNLDILIARSCQWMGDYLKNNPNLKDADHQICKG
jgi:WD40 repeat protein